MVTTTNNIKRQVNNIKRQVWRPDMLTKLYVFSLCLLIYAVADVSWLMRIPRQPLYILVIAFAIIKMMLRGASFSKGRWFWISIWFVYCMISILITNATGTIRNAIYYLMLFLAMSTVAMLSDNEMKYLLKAITNCFVFILVVSLTGWILYLIGVPLPATGPYYHSDGFHVYYDYYFFTTSNNYSDYARFSSVFLEPGQMATPCVFLFHLNTRNDRIVRFRNLIMLIGIILSFSLIAYGLLLLSIVANQLTRSNTRYKMAIAVGTLLLLGGVSWYFVTHEDTAVYALIVSRLEYDESTNQISGYNRTGENFEARYANLMQSSDKYFGVHSEITGGDNWTSKASGYKKFIVHHGIVGLSIVLFMMVILFWNNRSTASFVFFIMVVLAFLVRDLLTSPLWLTTAVIGMYTIGSEKKITAINKVKKRNVETDIVKKAQVLEGNRLTLEPEIVR